jgi:hypothetical protein
LKSLFNLDEYFPDSVFRHHPIVIFFYMLVEIDVLTVFEDQIQMPSRFLKIKQLYNVLMLN